MDKPSKYFLPPAGSFRKLYTFQKAEIIYDTTVVFTRKFLKPGDRTIDQMVQAARSGKQNIAEGSMASATSKEMELKLTNVARASLQELLLDYEDYIRVNGLLRWPKEHPWLKRLYELIMAAKPLTYASLKAPIEHHNPEIVANTAITLLMINDGTLRKQIQQLQEAFVNTGGIKELMNKARRKQ